LIKVELVTTQNLLYGALAFAVAYPAVYGLGWAWSRGFHRGKREFVERLVKDNCEKEHQ
jgi:hypothetical protein